MASYEEKALEFLGITRWHELGYKGKGIKILSDERVYEKAFPNVISPSGFTSKRDHGSDVMAHIQLVAPEATFYAYPFNGTFGSKTYSSPCANYIRENQIHVFTTSKLGSTVNAGKRMAMQDCIDSGCIFFAAAGNDGDPDKGDDTAIHGESRCDLYYAIGGIKPKFNGKYDSEENAQYDWDNLTKVGYSSVGPELDYVTIAEILGPNGTSFCAPVFAAMVGLVQQFFEEKAGRRLTRMEMAKFIADNLLDIEAEGFDNRTGFGCFILPEPSTIDVAKYTGSAPIAPETPIAPSTDELVLTLTIDSHEVDINGIKKTFDVAPFIQDSRTFVPIALLRELGLDVEWLADTRQVVVTK